MRDYLEELQAAFREHDLLVHDLRPRLSAAALWDLVHLVRFRGWLLDNLGASIPAAIGERLATIDPQYRSPRYSEPTSAMDDLIALGERIGALQPADIQLPWDARREHFKPRFRHLVDFVRFMIAHDAYHLGRASAHCGA